MLQTSEKGIIKTLFPDKVDLTNKKKPKTSGFKIKSQCATLVEDLMKCTPHYVRCIKSNDQKRGDFMEDERVAHQIQYLGLLENIKVRRAGFAYRNEFFKLVQRFKLLSPETENDNFAGSDKQAAKAILKSAAKELKFTKEEVQLGKSMVFIKTPETLFAMDTMKQDKLGVFASKIQRCFRRYKDNKKYVLLRHAANKVFGNKERRRESYYRPYEGLYFRIKDHKAIATILEQAGDGSRVQFCDRVQRLCQAGGASKGKKEEELDTIKLAMVLTKQALYLIEEEEQAGGGGKQRKGKPVRNGKAFLRRRIALEAIKAVSVSELADNYACLHVEPLKNTVQPIEWVPDKEAKSCTACQNGFGLFTRKHHCRLCARLFCDECTSKGQVMPDLGYYTPVRVCDTCFGMESRDPLGDQLLRTGKKTEFISLLVDLFKSQQGEQLEVNIVDKIKYKPLPDLDMTGKAAGGKKGQGTGKSPVAVNAELVFKRKENAKGTKTTAVSGTKVSVTVPAGLSTDFVAERQRAAAKRRQAYAEKQKKEAIKRKQRDAERNKQREAERKERLAEKKKRKAELRAEMEAKKPGGSRGGKSANVGPCKECGCSSFVKNMFKADKCNTCFHVH